jgi:uncharacterized membrane protein YhaH (DUF805 family)
MRFLTTVTPAGRLEYFLIGIVLNVAFLFATFTLLALDVDPFTREVSYAAEKLAVYSFIGAGYLVLAVINMLRRMKDLHLGSGWIILAFIPIVSFLFQLMLFLSSGIESETYTPYGKDPYDPNSWVPPTQSTGANSPSVTFQGKALMLPGEDRWEDNAA